MASEALSAAKPERWVWLDGLRGIAIIAMAIYHLTWDLTFFHFVSSDVLRSTLFVLFGHAIACSFLAIAGFALALASFPRLDPRAFLFRLGKIAAAALLVTIATWFAFPQSFVNFGILHCIAAASLLSVAFVRAPFWLSALAGAAIFAAGLYIESPYFDAVNGWIGLGQRIPLTNDWRPLFPWSGAMLLGLALGQYVLPRRLIGHVRPLPPKSLAWAGRHSLPIYLLHQPLLFGLVWLAAQIVSPNVMGTVPPETFVRACTDRCTAAGGAADNCSRTCACIPREALKAGIWTIIATGKPDERAQARYEEVIAFCRRPPATGG